MSQFSSTQKWAVGGVVGLIVLAILLYFFVFTSSEGWTQTVNPCADAEAGEWQEGKWHDGEVLFEGDAESDESCAALGEEWNDTHPNKVDLLTYDHIYQLCAGKKLIRRTYTAYKMLALGHCEDMEYNNFNPLSYNKQFDTVIANQGEFAAPKWTDITDDTAKAAATEGLDINSTATDQCSRGTRWLHDENLIIPGETWIETAFNPYPVMTTNRRAAIQIIKGNPEVDLRKFQTNEDYESEDKTYLSVYLRCKGSSDDDDPECVADRDDRPVDNESNVRYQLNEVKQRPTNTGTISNESHNMYLGSYKNDNGYLNLKETQSYRPPPGQYKPFDVGEPTTDSTRPSGCYVDLGYTNPYPDGVTRRTGSLRYNINVDTNSSHAKRLYPKICQATETVPQVCEVDSEFSLLFL